MQTGTVQARYAEDKPKSCDYCYFKSPASGACGLDACFYLLAETGPEPSVYRLLHAEAAYRNADGEKQGRGMCRCRMKRLNGLSRSASRAGKSQSRY